MIRLHRTSARLAAIVCILLAGIGCAVARGRTAEDVSAQFNQTGRAMPMTVALKDSGRSLGDVIILVEKDDSVAVSKDSLLAILQKDGAAEIAGRLAGLAAMIPLKDLAGAGLDIRFDKQQIALVMALKADQRQAGDISLAATPPLSSGALAKPATFSGYLNLFAESDYFWNEDRTALRFDAEAVLRAWDVVLETELAVENQVNSRLCPTGAFCFFDHTPGVKRRGSRLVYDSPEAQNRLTVGDTHTWVTTFQRSPDVAGFTLEHSPSKLDPTRSIRATGAQSFVLERASVVDVLINGAVSQRLHLPPGSYNLRDLPLRSGANEIKLLVSDESGASRTLTFNTYSGAMLLGQGKSEWSMTAGVPSTYRDGAIDYLDNQYFASAFGRYGVTSALTLEAHGQADTRVSMGGFGALVSTSFGIWGLHAAASQTGAGVGTGGALRATWDLGSQDTGESLRLTGEWHTPGFRTPGQIYTETRDIFYPIYDYRSSYSAAYTRPFLDIWQASVTARYDFENKQFTSINPLVVRGDRYHVDFSLTRPLFDNATVSGTIGYSNEIYNRSFTYFTPSKLNETQGEVWAGLRVFWRPEERTIVTTSSDSLTGRTMVSGSYRTSPGIGSWTTSVDVADDRYSKHNTVNADVSYRGQRGEITVGHDATDPLLFLSSGEQVTGAQRTRVRAGTALVFADDAVAISSPIRGEGGFAILKAHESLGDRVVTAGTPDYVRARSDALGPAVASGFAAYAPQSLPVDVADLPVGYSLGSSAFDLRPTYKAGYQLEVGSGYSVSALGELLDEQGQPQSLVAGFASDGTRQVTVFTNQAGKFAADGLAPGRWTLTMETERGKTVYRIDIPKGANGLVRLGALRPDKRS